MHAHVLVQLLTVRAALCGVHHDVLGRHKRQLAAEVLLDDLRVDDEAVRHVHHEVQDRVGREERLRHADTLVRRVVERALEPLRRSRDGRVQRVDHDVAREGRDALAAHRVALVRHRGGTDLILLERLLDLLEVLQQADVVRELRRALRDAAQHVQHLAVELSRVGLAGYGKARLVAQLLGDLAVDLRGELVVAVKELEEARLRAGRALRAEQLRLADLVLDVLEVHQELLDPERRALADGRRLCGLEVRESQRRQILVFLRELRKHADDVDKLFADDLHRLGHDDDIGIIAHVAARRAEVDDASRLRALLAVGVDMAHHVVADYALARFGDLIVDVVGMRLELVDLLLRDRQAELHLAFRQRDPQAAPRFELHIRREKVFHLLVGIAGGKWGFVGVSHSIDLPFCSGTAAPHGERRSVFSEPGTHSNT